MERNETRAYTGTMKRMRIICLCSFGREYRIECINIRRRETMIAIAPHTAEMASVSSWKVKLWLSKRGFSVILMSSSVELHCGQPILGK